MPDKPTKGQALRNALEEIDKHYTKPKSQGGKERSIEERKAAAMKKLEKGYSKANDTEDTIAKAELISTANQKNIDPVISDIKTIGGAVKSAGDTVRNAKNAYSTIKSKMSADAGKLGARSLIGKASQNLFEFPVFMSSSVPLEYATAINSLLEQMYASYLQMAVSINPVVDKKDVDSGKVFQNLKTDITKFVEYAEYDWQRAACHNVITTDDTIAEFDMINITDSESKILLEAMEYEPLSEFDHFFVQEASHSKPRDVIKRLEKQIDELEDEEDQLIDDRKTGVIDQDGLERLPELRKELSSLRKDLSSARKELSTASERASAEAERKANEAERKAAQEHREEEKRKNQEHREQLTRETDEERRRRHEREDAEEARAQAREDREKENQSVSNYRFNMDRSKHAVDMKVKAPQMLDETKIQKLNTMKPLMMQVGIKVMSDTGIVSDMIDYVVGVRTHCRIVKAEVLPDVAEYPLKEMSTLTRKAKWRAGEIKFLDFLFAHKEKKQAAYDSRDINRKWYHRLYTLAHSKGSRSLAQKITGKTASGGLIPNATIVMTKADVDMIDAEKGIDLLKPGTARSFCNELFLMSLIVVDIDAQSIKILLPDINNDYEVQSLASVQKQIATLDTSGTISREVSKIMNGR